MTPSRAPSDLHTHSLTVDREACAKVFEPVFVQFKTLASDDRAPVREACAYILGGLILLAMGGDHGDGAEEVGRKGWGMLAKLLTDSSPEVSTECVSLASTLYYHGF